MPATAATTAPLEAVFKREEVMPVIARELVVALVPVAFMKVKFCRVEEAVARRLANVPRPVEVKLPPLA